MGLAGPVRRSPLATALLSVLLKLYNEEQLKEDLAPGEADAAGEPVGDCSGARSRNASFLRRSFDKNSKT
eukprot:4130270-Amphidinium_carterae.1